MTYLLLKLSPWVLSALFLGILVGWTSCERDDQE